jgi:hypothetical protein
MGAIDGKMVIVHFKKNSAQSGWAPKVVAERRSIHDDLERQTTLRKLLPCSFEPNVIVP